MHRDDPDRTVRVRSQAAAAAACRIAGGRAQPVVRLDGVHKSFDGQTVLDGVSLTVAAGEKLSLVGTTGCGKTVLAKHFNGLLTPDAGTVRVAGQDVAEADPAHLDDIRRHIGYVFQGNVLLDSAICANVYENVSLPLRRDPYDIPAAHEKQIEARVAEVLAEVGLDRSFFDRHPNELSGGQQKRVAIARAIAPSPPVIIYDEPTTGLDPEYTAVIIDLIDELHETQGTTTIAITHEPKLMERLERVVFLREGRVYFDGSFDRFSRSADPVIAQFLAHDESPRRCHVPRRTA